MKHRPQLSDAFRLTSPVRPKHDYSYFVGVIYREYRKATRLRCPWDAACGQQLKAALWRLRNWPSERIEQAITNKFASDENQCLSAKVWLPRLEDYAAGPLDRYHLPMRSTAVQCPKHPQSGRTEWGTCWGCYEASARSGSQPA